MNILVLRLSAMGDVALTIPVIKGVVEQHPDVKITMVTRQAFAPFFNTLPEVRLFHPSLARGTRAVRYAQDIQGFEENREF